MTENVVEITRVSSHTGKPIATPEEKLETYNRFIELQDPENNFYQKTGLALVEWLEEDKKLQAEGKLGDALGTVGNVSYDEVYLNHLPEEHRQVSNCNCCRAWFGKNAGTVSVSKDGKVTAIFLKPELAPEHLKGAVAHAKAVVEAMDVSDYYTSDALKAGQYKRGDVIVDGKLHGTFSHWHNADASEYTVRTSLAAHNAMVGFVQHMPNSDNLLTKGVDLRRAILEIDDESKVVNGHIAMLNAYLECVRAVRAGRRDLVTRQVAWNQVFYQFANFSTLEHFRGTSIGKALESYIDDGDLRKALSQYFDKIDPLKHKRAIAAAADGHIRNAEKFITENGYTKSIAIRAATAADYLATNQKTGNSIWNAPVVEAKPVEPEKPATVFGNLYAGARDEQGAAAIEKPVFHAKEITVSRFIAEVLPKALSMKYVKRKSYAHPLESARNLARQLSFVLESGIEGKPIWKEDVASIERCGERYNMLNVNLDATNTDYLSVMPRFWTGSNASEFVIENVSIRDRLEESDIPSRILFMTRDLSFTDVQLVNPTMFPTQLIGELDEYRAVLEQFIRTSKYGRTHEPCNGFGIITVGEAFPSNNYIVVETEVGFQPYDIRGSH